MTDTSPKQTDRARFLVECALGTDVARACDIKSVHYDRYRIQPTTGPDGTEVDLTTKVEPFARELLDAPMGPTAEAVDLATLSLRDRLCVRWELRRARKRFSDIEWVVLRERSMFHRVRVGGTKERIWLDAAGNVLGRISKPSRWVFAARLLVGLLLLLSHRGVLIAIAHPHREQLIVPALIGFAVVVPFVLFLLALRGAPMRLVELNRWW